MRLPLAQGETGQATRLAIGGAGLLAAGGRTCEVDGGSLDNCLGEVWTSETGSDWARIDHPALAVDEGVATAGVEPGVIDVAGSGDVAVVVGHAMDDLGDVAIWRIGPDLAVERVPLGRTFEDAEPAAVVATAAGFAVVGARLLPDKPEAAVWWSPDGLSWQGMRSGDWSDVGGYHDTGEGRGHGGMHAAAPFGSGLAAIGVSCSSKGGDCRSVAWRSRDGATWERVEASNRGAVLFGVGAGGEAVTAVGYGNDVRAPGVILDWSTDESGLTSEPDWPAFHAVAATLTERLLLGWVDSGPPSLWHRSAEGVMAQLADPPEIDGDQVRGGDLELVPGGAAGLVSVENGRGVEGFVLLGEAP